MRPPHTSAPWPTRKGSKSSRHRGTENTETERGGDECGWTRIGISQGPRPRLADAAETAFADRRATYDMELALWKAQQEFHDKTGGADPRVAEFVDVGRQQVYWHYRLGIGDGGFQAETGSYAFISSWYPLVYATAHRNVFGRDASAWPDATHLMPRRMMQVLFREGGSTAVQKINSVAGFDVRWCAAAFPILPANYQAPLLWAWNLTTGVKDEKTVGNALTGTGLNLAHAFLHYPLAMKPIHPREAMPLTWEASTFGFHCFRSGWQGKDEFIGQVFLKASLVGGWNHPNAGTFRLMGLGHEWTVGATERGAIRVEEPIVLLPDDQINEGGCGRLTYLRTWPDGSGSPTIDLGDVYAAPSKGLYDRNLVRWPDRLEASGIKGLRAIAFDYGGRSGAPCLLALVDRIDGGKTKEWLWQLPSGSKDAGNADDARNIKSKVKIEGASFTLDYGDASMNATFAAPEAVKIEVPDRTSSFESHGTNIHKWNAVMATGGDAFFLVATFQRGPAPPVKIDGKGLDARITVGGQTIRFDGQKLLLGPAE